VISNLNKATQNNNCLRTPATHLQPDFLGGDIFVQVRVPRLGGGHRLAGTVAHQIDAERDEEVEDDVADEHQVVRLEDVEGLAGKKKENSIQRDVNIIFTGGTSI